MPLKKINYFQEINSVPKQGQNIKKKKKKSSTQKHEILNIQCPVKNLLTYNEVRNMIHNEGGN